jgi:hypothetical protein
MAYHQGIGIAAYHPDSIGQGLALGDGAALCRPEVNDASAQSLHGRLKGHARASGWFKEKQSQDLAIEYVALFLAPGIGLQGRGEIENGVDLLPGKLSHGEHVPLHEHGLVSLL